MCFLLYTSDHLRLVCDLVVFLSLRVYLFLAYRAGRGPGAGPWVSPLPSEQL